MQNSTRATISIVAIACLLYGIASIALAVPFFVKQHDVVREWPSAVATVCDSSVVEVTAGGQKLWATRFELSFVTGDRIQQVIVNAYRQGSNYQEVRAAASRFSKGSDVTIRYNPVNPNDVRLDTNDPRRYYQLPLALGITGAVFIVIALALMIYVRRASRV